MIFVILNHGSNRLIIHSPQPPRPLNTPAQLFLSFLNISVSARVAKWIRDVSLRRSEVTKVALAARLRWSGWKSKLAMTISSKKEKDTEPYECVQTVHKWRKKG